MTCDLCFSVGKLRKTSSLWNDGPGCGVLPYLGYVKAHSARPGYAVLIKRNYVVTFLVQKFPFCSGSARYSRGASDDATKPHSANLITVHSFIQLIMLRQIYIHYVSYALHFTHISATCMLHFTLPFGVVFYTNPHPPTQQWDRIGFMLGAVCGLCDSRA